MLYENYILAMTEQSKTEEDITLINHIKGYSLLYDREHPEYNDNQLRASKMQEIAKKMGKDGKFAYC